MPSNFSCYETLSVFLSRRYPPVHFCVLSTCNRNLFHCVIYRVLQHTLALLSPSRNSTLLCLWLFGHDLLCSSFRCCVVFPFELKRQQLLLSFSVIYFVVVFSLFQNTHKIVCHGESCGVSCNCILKSTLALLFHTCFVLV